MSEKVLELILDKLTSMDDRMGNMEMRMDNMEMRMGNMEMRMGNMEMRMDHMEEKQDLMQTQLDETSRILKAVYDRQEVSDAKLTALSSDVDKLHGYVKKIDKKVDRNQQSLDKMIENQAAIFEMLGEHDVSIRALKKKARSS
ncbi:hypothetical protein [Sporolactobacillus inulinus]|uniref:Chromosome partition protein smc n=2 Tax=Sporolactobacillus inulinus TaxID=2078 RepID=A0A4Y1ZIE4_9BACL|nr:hypothetical protein [Sporolactobacillus inulinus]KLI02147.1 hypothetical protein SINU_09635 [Sporolactobacillus inulinus CASD]GAY78855.1 hypothetical protein NBRC111894_4409 [Sporolactobacillus inulinus]GEB78046.1 hypothetical protein SIN01_23910 [Sporolactobacillus inulinus]